VFSTDFPAGDYEVIVVDNGSLDRTREIARARGATVYELQGGNISTLRNFGARKAAGEILVFLDADCTVPHNWFQEAGKYLDRDDIVCFGSQPVIPDNASWVSKTWILVREMSVDVEDVFWLASTNMFIRKKVFLEAGGFNEKLETCEDVDLSYRLSGNGRIVADKHISAIHHREPATVKEFFRKERWRGKSNYSSVKEHGFRFDEMPSLILPLFYLAMLLLAIVFALTGHCILSVVTAVIWQVPLLAIVCMKLFRVKRFGSFFQLFALYNIYFCARGCSIFSR
jgi:GT2 family glycosyltransferase